MSDDTIVRDERAVVGKGVLTRYLWIGGDVSSKPKNVFVVVPGNPGLSGFYETLMILLWRGLSDTSDTAIWCVSHAGHDTRADPPINQENEDVYSLEGQIEHKYAFIEKAALPPDVRMTLIGHSMGSYVILRLMKKLKMESNVEASAAYFLFPMIERMAETPNGSSFFFQHLSVLRRPLIFLTWLVSWLPEGARYSLIKACQSCQDQPSVRAINDYVNATAVEACIHLAQHEMAEIKALDLQSLTIFKEKVRCLYGQNDGWAPKEYRESLLKAVPEVRTEMADMPHAFVLHENQKVADIILRWIKEDGL